MTINNKYMCRDVENVGDPCSTGRTKFHGVPKHSSEQNIRANARESSSKNRNIVGVMKNFVNCTLHQISCSYYCSFASWCVLYYQFYFALKYRHLSHSHFHCCAVLLLFSPC
jgi:hypothetical protein